MRAADRVSPIRLFAEDREGGPRNASSSPFEICFRPITGPIYIRYNASKHGNVKECDRRGEPCGAELREEEVKALKEATLRLTSVRIDSDEDGSDSATDTDEENVVKPADRRAERRLKVTLCKGSESKYLLQTTCWAGRIAFAQRVAIIEPKPYVPMSFDAQMQMFAEGSGLPAFKADIKAEGLDSDPALVISLVYAHAASQALAKSRGPLLDYRKVHRSLPFVRGRIDFQRQLRTQPSLVACSSVACSYSELVDDTPQNRLIKAAAIRTLILLRESDVADKTPLRDAAKKLENVVRALRSVQARSFSPHELATIPDCPNPRYLAYRTAVQLAKVVLRDSTVGSVGSGAGFSYLVNMNTLFEGWCRSVLTAAGGEFGFECVKRKLVAAARRTAHSVKPHKFEPDLIFTVAAGECVGDIKYKRLHLSKDGRLLTPRDDAHQIMSYMFQTAAKSGLLVYGACDPPGYASSCTDLTSTFLWRAGWSESDNGPPIYILCLDLNHESGLEHARRQLRHAAWHCACDLDANVHSPKGDEINGLGRCEVCRL